MCHNGQNFGIGPAHAVNADAGHILNALFRGFGADAVTGTKRCVPNGGQCAHPCGGRTGSGFQRAAYLAAVADHAGDSAGHIADGVTDLFVVSSQEMGDCGRCGGGRSHNAAAHGREFSNPGVDVTVR